MAYTKEVRLSRYVVYGEVKRDGSKIWLGSSEFTHVLLFPFFNEAKALEKCFKEVHARCDSIIAECEKYETKLDAGKK